MSTSKPNSAYYREIATRIGCAPSECVMVGNEVEMDILPARRVGMKTFWVTDAGALPTDVPAIGAAHSRISGCCWNTGFVDCQGVCKVA
jgi:FMN phosphatase YigB (HAD superfamily)